MTSVESHSVDAIPKQEFVGTDDSMRVAIYASWSPSEFRIATKGIIVGPV
jgi:hypothetical protein